MVLSGGNDLNTTASNTSSTVVIGDGWSALAAIGFLSDSARIHWIPGTGSRVIPPLPGMEARSEIQGLAAWQELAKRFGVECGSSQTGSFLREFKNKAFREPAWSRGPDAESRASIVQETLWEGEHSLVPLFEGRFLITLAEIESRIREAVSQLPADRVIRMDGVPVTGFRIEDRQVRAVILGSGEEIVADRVIYADRWSEVPKLHGLPKGLGLLRKREPVGVLQATFSHHSPLAIGVQEGFFAVLHREVGEENDKHVWGHFSSDGLRSVWTSCLLGEEVEDNHAIGKRLRRMKSALDKMFTGSAWLPQNCADFMQTVASEQVRFEEGALLSGGEPVVEPVRVSGATGLSFLTDGYGPAHALHQAAVEVGILDQLGTAGLSAETNAETEGVNLAEAGLS